MKKKRIEEIQNKVWSWIHNNDIDSDIKGVDSIIKKTIEVTEDTEKNKNVETNKKEA